MTLHRSADHAESPSRPVGNPCISGRTLIACQNCASAKTGCDKKIPCSRCIEKNLQCIARYARRASKAAIRAAQAASVPTKDRMAGFDFRPQQFQNSSLSFAPENHTENTIQSSIRHLQGGTARHDDNIWDIFNPLSPLSAAAPSLGSSSSYSDNLNAFERKQNSPVPIHLPEFSTNIHLIDNDASIRMQKSHRCYAGNLENRTMDPSFLSSDMSSLQRLEDFASFVGMPDACEDASSFLTGFRSPELDFANAPNEPYLWLRPNLSCARTWMRKLRQKGLFDSHAPNMSVGESIHSYQPSKTYCQYSDRDRLVYSWVQMDQELSLFADAEQTLSASDLERPLPDPNLPWDARGILQTSKLYLMGGLYRDIKTEEALSFEFRPTFNRMLRDFAHGSLSDKIPPRHLQLLLHPLQALVRHSQSLLSLANCSSSPVLSNTANSSLLETQRLLRAWHNLAVEACNDNNAHARDAALGLILYHFICLNLTASFADIERLASRESLGASSWQQSLQTERCIRSRQETIFHSGQALRYLRAVNADARPWWWPTAVHRAILTLWAASTLGLSPWRQGSVDTQPGASMPASELSVVAIDNTAPENPAFGDANWSEKHMLVLARQDEGAVALSDAMGILQYGISLINSFPGSVEGEAVVAKLKALGQVWKGSNGSHVYL